MKFFITTVSKLLELRILITCSIIGYLKKENDFLNRFPLCREILLGPYFPCNQFVPDEVEVNLLASCCLF